MCLFTFRQLYPLKSCVKSFMPLLFEHNLHDFVMELLRKFNDFYGVGTLNTIENTILIYQGTLDF